MVARHCVKKEDRLCGTYGIKRSKSGNVLLFNANHRMNLNPDVLDAFLRWLKDNGYYTSLTRNLHTTMYVLKGVINSHTNLPDGHLKIDRKEIPVAMFEFETDAQDYLRKSRLKSPGSGGEIFKKKSLLANFQNAFIDELSMDCVELNPKIDF